MGIDSSQVKMNTIFKKPRLTTNLVLRAFILSLAASITLGNLHADVSEITGIEAPQKNVRIMHNQDGTYTEFRQSPDERIIERRTYGDRPGGGGDRVLRMVIIYRKDVHGKLRSGSVLDGAGNKLYRIVYGYHKRSGNLVAEDMFDARVKRTKIITDPETKQPREEEYPVRYLRYLYDAQGRQMKPIVICTPEGKTAEELFGKEGSSYVDPWANSKTGTANPNAKPLR